jgi:DNA repair photolyase
MSDVKNKTGVDEWAENSINCCYGCSNGCLYCFARKAALNPWPKASRPGRIFDGGAWVNERPNTLEYARLAGAYGRKYKGVVMFPTTHDWTGGTAEACGIVLGRMLAAGNQVLLVSKLSVSRVPQIIKAIDSGGGGARDRIEVRVTCGGLHEATRGFWEPGAPPFEERLAAIRLLRRQKACWRVSASAEPLLEPDRAAGLVAALAQAGAAEIWIGMMREMKSRLAWKYRSPRDWPLFVGELDELQRSDARILAMARALRPWRTYVSWKDSYRAVLERNGVIGTW